MESFLHYLYNLEMCASRKKMDLEIAYENWQSIQVTSAFMKSVSSVLLYNFWKENNQSSGFIHLF